MRRKLAGSESGIISNTLANIISTAILFVYNIYIRNSLSVFDAGIYTTATMLLNYSAYLQLGVLNAYNRDYPQLLGAEKREDAKGLKSVVFTYLIIAYALFAVVTSLVIVAVGKLGSLNHNLLVGLALSSVIALPTILYTYFDFTNKSEKRFTFAAVQLVAKSVLLVAVGYFAIKEYGFIGIYIGQIPSLLFIFGVNFKTIRSVKWTVNFRKCRNIMGTGIVLLINSLAWTVMMSVDKIVILSFLSMEELGIYSVALMCFSTLVILPKSMSQVFYVKLSQNYGKYQSVEKLMAMAKSYTLLTSIVTSLISICVFYLFPVFVRLIMPMYVACIPSTEIITIGVALYSTTILYGNVLSVLRKNKILLVTTVILCLLNFVLSVALIFLFDMDILYVALGSSVSYAAYSLIVVRKISAVTGEKTWTIAAHSTIVAVVSIAAILITNAFDINMFGRLAIALSAASAVYYLMYRGMRKPERRSAG